MSYILSDRRNTPEDTKRAFEEYAAYIRTVGGRLPPSAIELATSDWYFENGPKSPHDSWLDRLTFFELGSGSRHEKRKLGLELRLLGAYHDGYIQFSYTRIHHYSLGSNGSAEGHGDWLWDEFTLSESGYLLHVIEWQHAVWTIEADDIHYEWIPLQGCAA